VIASATKADATPGAAPRPRVVLAGGSGFLGQALAGDLIARGYDVAVLTRTPRAQPVRVREAAWDGRTLGPWAELLDGAAAAVNLTGRSVNCRYTAANQREIIDSRIDSVRAVGAAIARCARPPAAWVQAGSLAIYGDAGARVCDESAPHGRGFSVDVCERWENAFAEHRTPGTRKTLLRIGFALGRGGGALVPLARLARFGLGGTVGSGRQYISWLHVHDLNAMFRWAIERADVAGTYNATGPSPVTNAEFMRALRRALRRPWSPPTPAPLVHLGAFLMRTEPSLALTGRRCVPARFAAQGFTFAHADVRETLRDVLR
jgi:uncharacterized protein (TIGR01777 family)